MKCRFARFLVLPLAVITLQPFSRSESDNAPPPAKMRVAVVVTDAHGNPVRDLSSGDFVLEVAGKAQPVQLAAPASAPEQSQKDGHGLVVVVIDTMHTRWAEEKDLRFEAAKYMAECAKRDVPVSLLVLSRDGTLNAVHEYTTSSTDLSAALAQADAQMHHQAPAPGVSPAVTAEAQRFVDFYKGEGKFSSPEAIRAYPEIMLRGLGTVAHYVANVPGRKSLIWISSTMPFAVDEKSRQIASPTLQTQDPWEAMYPNLLTADQVKELQGSWKESIAALQSSEVALYPVQTRATPNVRTDPEVLHSMASLAHMTGGLEVHSVGDVFPQFRDLAENNRSAYQLELPTDGDWSCKADWCDMKVTVKRTGAHVLAPEGFFRNTGASAAQPSAAAAQPAEAPPAASGIAFTVNWKPAEAAGAKKKVGFVVAFAPSAGIPAEGSADLNVEVIVHAFSNGTDKGAISFGANTHLPQDTLDQIHNKGFVLNNAIELEPGDYDVRFLVHDKTTGRVGVLNLPLRVA
ncbi:MAG TPA: VWA domain-containing protein [Verrucomicrobiae bacterium]|nr:VWA domain-containing protein [Verrucomicrobiae bacterium]